MNEKSVFNIHPFKKLNIKIVIFLIIILSTTSLSALGEPCPIMFSEIPVKYSEILVISSHPNENKLWENKILNELTNLFDKSELNVHYQSENLGKYNTDKDYLSKQADLWNIKYGNTPLDLVITLDDESLSFVHSFHHLPFLKNTPVVYGGINDVGKLSSYSSFNSTGVTEFVDVNALISQVKKITPKTSNINILLDTSISSTTIENQFRDWIPYYKDILTLNFVKSNYIEEICNSIGKSNDPLIIVGNFRDKNNDVFLSPDDTVSILKKQITGNIYTLNESYIYSGVLGGNILQAKNHSQLLYDISRRILSGESCEDIPDIYDSSSVFIFDAVQLHSRSISRKILPNNSLFINDSWIYKGVSMAIVITLALFLIIAIVLLGIQLYERKKNERKVIAANKRYNQILVNDKIKTEFFANFSHEIRTLLNVMLSGLQLLDVYKNNGRLNFTNKEDEIKLKYIKQNGYRLLKLINNLIDMTKIDSGFYNVDLEVKNVVEVVEDITMSVVEHAENRGITIIFDTNEEETYMPLDSEKLDRIVLNLLSNAIKFTPDGGYIYVTMNCNKKSISVSVKDTGIGIPKEKQDSIFERFTQVNDSNNRSKEVGSGIGLSLVYSLVHLLDGTISLISEENQGCEFMFTLPIKDFDIANKDVQENISKNINSNSERLMVELSDVNNDLDA